MCWKHLVYLFFSRVTNGVTAQTPLVMAYAKSSDMLGHTSPSQPHWCFERNGSRDEQYFTKGHKDETTDRLFAFKLYKWIIYQRTLIFTSAWNSCIYVNWHWSVLK